MYIAESPTTNAKSEVNTGLVQAGVGKVSATYLVAPAVEIDES